MSSFDRTGGPLRATRHHNFSRPVLERRERGGACQPNDDLVCQNDATKLGTDRYLRAASLDLEALCRPILN